MRSWLDAFAADGSADAYRPEVHRAIVARLRYVGVAGIGLGALVYGARRALAAACGTLARAAAALGRDLRRVARRLWAEEPASHLGALVAIVGIGLGVRAWLLGWPMRYDEAYTFLNYARDPLILGLTRYDTPNNHLFHTLLVHVAYQSLGDAPWVLRLPAFLAGVLVVPASYLTVRVLYGPRAALLATALVATSMPAIEISTNARGYSLVTLLFLLLVCLGAHLRRTNNEAGWVLFAALGTLGLYTIPTGLYALAATVGWLLLSAWAGEVAAPPRRFVVALVGAVAATGVMTAALYAPLLVRTDLPTLLSSPIVSLKVQPVSWGAFVGGNAGKLVDAWRRWGSDWPRWCQAVWLTGIAAALALHRRLANDRVPFVAGLALGCVPLLMVQRVVPPSRVWIFLLPVFAGMGAAGVLHVLGWVIPRLQRDERRWRQVPAGLALLLVAGGALSVPARSRAYVYNLPDFPDAEKTVTFLAPRLRPGDKVLVLGLSQTPFLYYAGRSGLPYLSHLHDYVLEGWRPLRDARRIFVVVNEREHTLQHVLTEAGLADTTPSLVAVAAFEAARIYLVTRD